MSPGLALLTAQAAGRLLVQSGDKKIAPHRRQKKARALPSLRDADAARNAAIDSRRQQELRQRLRFSHFSHQNRAYTYAARYLQNSRRYWANWYAKNPKMKMVFTPANYNAGRIKPRN